jgi:hypothetical protein
MKTLHKIVMAMTECPPLHHLNTKVDVGNPVTVKKSFFSWSAQVQMKGLPLLLPHLAVPGA